MFSRPSPLSPTNNPILDSVFFQQNDIGTATPPPPFNMNFLLLSGLDFHLLSGSNLLLL